MSALRNELSDVYKMQGQNTQKLLTMTEVSSSSHSCPRCLLHPSHKKLTSVPVPFVLVDQTLQEKEHQARVDQEELRRLTDGETKWKKGTDEWTARLREKDVGIQVSQRTITRRRGLHRVGVIF